MAASQRPPRVWPDFKPLAPFYWETEEVRTRFAPPEPKQLR